MQSLIQALTTLHYPKEAMSHQVLPLFHPMDIPDTQTVLRAGEVPDKLYLVCEGLGRLYYKKKVKQGNNRKTVEVSRLVAGPGEWLTVPDAFIGQTSSSDQIELSGGSKVFYVFYEDFTRLCQTDSQFSRAAQHLWTDLIRKGFEREEVMKILHPLESRVDLFLEKHHPYFERYKPNGTALASLVGVSESTVKRYFSKRKA